MTIAATLDLGEATRKSWDIVVVGAGPAGALAARELARRGSSVLLVDKANFPRWKVCGCCLNGWAMSSLAAAGLGDLVKDQGGIALDGVQLGAGGGQARIGLPGEWALSRIAFDASLIQAALRAGVHFLPGTLARLGGPVAGGRELSLRQERLEVPARAGVILAADGLGCRLLGGQENGHGEARPGSRLGAGVVVEDYPDFYRTPRIFMACGTGGYVGLVRVEDGRLNLAAALDPDQVKKAGGLGKAAQAILVETGFPSIPDLASLAWHGTPLLTRQTLRPAAERVFLLGDAAGYVEPFTGEGMAWALACARAVTPLAQRGARQWDPSLIRTWTHMYRTMIQRRQWVIRTLALVLRRPLLAHGLVATLARLPSLATPVVRYLSRNRS